MTPRKPKAVVMWCAWDTTIPEYVWVTLAKTRRDTLALRSEWVDSVYFRETPIYRVTVRRLPSKRARRKGKKQ